MSEQQLDQLDSKLNCLAVDDDGVFLELIEIFINEHPSLELFQSCNDAGTAERLLESGDVDLLLLDINMPNTSGFELMRMARTNPQVILVTAHREFAVEAFEYEVTDYLVKPLTQKRFNQAIQKAIKVAEYRRLAAVEADLVVRVGAKLTKIQCQNITLVEASGDYVKIRENAATHQVLGTLTDILSKLSEESFMRVHRKYIVRLDKVKSLEGNVIHLEDGGHASVSRPMKQELISKLSFN